MVLDFCVELKYFYRNVNITHGSKHISVIIDCASDSKVQHLAIDASMMKWDLSKVCRFLQCPRNSSVVGNWPEAVAYLGHWSSLPAVFLSGQ